MSKEKTEESKPREVDQEKMEKNYELTGTFLKKMEIKDLQENPKDHSYEIPLKFTFPDGFEIKLKTLFRVNDRHIMSKCLLIFYQDIKRSRDIDLKLNTLLLRANFDLFDVTYSVDQNQNVYVEMDVIPTANFEAFEDELNGLFYGIEYFFNKIMNEVFQEIKRQDTYNRYIG
ncbi:MAG: hypothetical protein ACFFD2_02280 [Promethearchaeota archaeon]